MASQAWDLPFPLDQLIRTQEVKVVQTVNAEALAATLRWLVDRLQKTPSGSNEPQGNSQEQADELKEQNEKLAQRLSEFEARQSEMESQLNDLKQGVATPSQADGLEGRVKALEEALSKHGNAEPALQNQDAAASDNTGAVQVLQDRVTALEDKLQQQGTLASEPVSAAPAFPPPPPPASLSAGDGEHASDALAGVLAELQGLKQQVQQMDTARQQLQPSSGAEYQQVQVQVSPRGDDGVNALASEMMARLQQLEAATPAAEQLLGTLNDLASRLAALELRAEMNGAAGGGGGGGDAQMASKAAEEVAAGHAAVANASNLDDALLIIRELYDKLSNKADRVALEPIIRRTSDMAGALGELGARLSVIESQQQQQQLLQQQQQQLQRPTTPPLSVPVDSATLGRVFDLETSVGVLTNQLQDAVGELQTGLQQLGGQVEQLAADLAGKADQSALDRLAVTAALAAAGGGADANVLTDMLTGLVADKASKAEVGLLSSQIQSKPSRDELMQVEKMAQEAAITAAGAMEKASDAVLASNEAAQAFAGAVAPAAGVPIVQGASKEQLEALAQQLGDMFADLAHLRQQINAQQAVSHAPVTLHASPGAGMQDNGPASPRGASAVAAVAVSSADMPGMQKMLASLRTDISGLQDALDWVAHASCIMAVGIEPQKVTPAAGAQFAVSPSPPPGLSAGKEPRNQRGAFDRLVKLLGRQSVGHKMDWFEPDTLNKMSQKLGMMESLMQNPQMRGMPMAPDAGMKDLEAQIRRLSKEVRSLREKQVDTGATPRMPDSDHAMLSGKPLMGYRCMACDRPLDKLHEKPGPYIPSHQMPVRLPTAPDAYMKAAMMRAPVVGAGMTPENSVGRLSKKAGHDPSQRGPQTWYEGDKGLPADALPTGDVGPKLPPGGWRGNDGQTAPGWRSSQAGAAPKPPPALPELPVVNQRTARVTGGSPAVKPQTSSQDLEAQDHAMLQMNMLPSL